jgi:two-component system, NtrC family, nitrogen regulation sensor histidine kinase NtrY
VLRAIAPIFPKDCPEHSRTREGVPIRGCRPAGAVVVTTVIPGEMAVHTNRIHRALTGHQQVKVFQGPLTTTYVTMLSTITLLVVFAGTWLGMRLAKAIAVPLNDLAGATRAVSQGNYDVVVPDPGGDELGQVVGAFNRMTGDLKASRSRLQAANTDLEARRRYMEVVLENIGAGVVALDRTGQITAMNDAAARLLALDDPRGPIGRHHTDVLPATYAGLAGEIVRELETSPVASLSRQVTISIKGETKTVSLTVTALRDDAQGYLGMVAVLDDLTPILRGQRVAAWREVARRIAHEIKNPLTPIQLSAQRLHRRFAPAITEGREVFDECTTTIETQVEELRRMVNEFSEFARMPEARPAPNNLNAVAGEAVSLYKNAHAGIEITFAPDSAVPVFDLDREQLKRGVINLLENAVQAVHEGGGTRVDIATDYDVKLGIVRLVVADDGPGISAEVKNRLFEPYFSTKKTGTGLGLTIVHRIVADHEGFIRVQDNKPRGTRMVIELPAKGATGGAMVRGAREKESNA